MGAVPPPLPLLLAELAAERRGEPAVIEDADASTVAPAAETASPATISF